jgi:hypothetical protein
MYYVKFIPSPARSKRAAERTSYTKASTKLPLVIASEIIF